MVLIIRIFQIVVESIYYIFKNIMKLKAKLNALTAEKIKPPIEIEMPQTNNIEH
jgi:hypothetical protein